MKFKILALGTLAVLMSCQTTDIGMNKAALKSMKTLAVLPFETAPGLDPKAAVEAQEALQSTFLKLGFQVLEREKILDLMKEKEMSLSDPDGAQRLGQLAGADGVIFGKVLQNRQYRTTVTEEPQKDLLSDAPPAPPVTYETDAFSFQVQIRVSSVSQGQIVLTLKNTWTNHVNDRKYIAIPSLEVFRSQVLDQMSQELQEAYLKN